MLTATIPIVQHPTDADRENGLALINRCMASFAAGMHTADEAVLRHEAERLESMPRSPVVRSMRAIVDGELATRPHGGEGGNR
jgi:hypothetical protein